MAQFASDTFTGTAGDTLDVYSANWTRHSASASGVNAVISDVQRVRTSAAGAALYYHSGTPANANYTVTADAVFIQTDGNASFSGIVGRLDTAANTYYMFRYIGSTTDGYQLYKLVAGTATQLGSTAPAAVAAGTVKSIKLSMDSDQIKGFVDGVSTIAVTDTAITAAGKAGVRPATAGADTEGIHLDNFSADDVAGGATPITASDTLTPSLTEAQVSLVTSSTTDTLLPSITESVNLAVLVVAVDTLTVSVTEAQTSLIGADVTDTVLVSVTEALVAFVTSSITDTLTPSITDTSAIGVTLAVSDTATPTVAEVANALAAFAISDTVTPGLTEVQASLVYAAVAEALTLSLGEVQGSLIASSVTDVFTLTVTEATSLLLGITATDTFIISVTDTAAVVSTTIIEKIGTDILAPYLTEAASLVLLDTWVKDGVVVGVWTASGGIVDGWTAADAVTGTWSEEPPFN